MENMRWLILSDCLRDFLTVSKIALHHAQIRQFRKLNCALRQIGPDYIPAARMEKLHQVRAYESLCSGHECGFFHWMDNLVSCCHELDKPALLPALGQNSA